LRFDVVHTPGHAPEHLTFVLTENVANGPVAAFTGDFIFAGDAGRPDLLEKVIDQKGSMRLGAQQLFAALQQFAKLPDHLLIWPGHGAGSACGKSPGGAPVTTLGYEKKVNWAFLEHDESRFTASIRDGQPDPPRYFARIKRSNQAGSYISDHDAKPPRLRDADIGRIREKGAVALDLRGEEDFGQKFIPGTLTLPNDGNFLAWAGQVLPDKATIYFIVETEQAALAATKALSLIGFNQIGGWFGPGALASWKKQGDLKTARLIEPWELPDQLESGSILLDVRRPDEFNKAHIPKARNIPLGHLLESAEDLPRNAPVIVQCQSGFRSRIAMSVLVRLGFTDVAELAGGFLKYQEFSPSPATAMMS
jgi:hydroxyacylglutathione hydrolase